jgi:hypothetical protein
VVALINAAGLTSPAPYARRSEEVSIMEASTVRKLIVAIAFVVVMIAAMLVSFVVAKPSQAAPPPDTPITFGCTKGDTELIVFAGDVGAYKQSGFTCVHLL